MRLVVDATVLNDIESIGAWIAKDNPAGVRSVLVRIVQTIGICSSSLSYPEQDTR